MICELQRKWSRTMIKRLNLQTQILSKMQIKLGTALRQSDVMLKQTGGLDLQSADTQANGEESTIDLQFSFSRKYDLKKRNRKKDNESKRGVSGIYQLAIR